MTPLLVENKSDKIFLLVENECDRSLPLDLFSVNIVDRRLSCKDNRNFEKIKARQVVDNF